MEEKIFENYRKEIEKYLDKGAPVLRGGCITEVVRS
jgi:hypothetical protein